MEMGNRKLGPDSYRVGNRKLLPWKLTISAKACTRVTKPLTSIFSALTYRLLNHTLIFTITLQKQVFLGQLGLL